jgi:hypothetical protein
MWFLSTLYRFNKLNSICCTTFYFFFLQNNKTLTFRVFLSICQWTYMKCWILNDKCWMLPFNI